MQKTPYHKRIAPTSWALGRPALQLARSLSLASWIRKGRAPDLVKRVRFRGQRPPRADLADVRVSPGAVVHAIAVNVGNWPVRACGRAEPNGGSSFHRRRSRPRRPPPVRAGHRSSGSLRLPGGRHPLVSLSPRVSKRRTCGKPPAAGTRAGRRQCGGQCGKPSSWHNGFGPGQSFAYPLPGVPLSGPLEPHKAKRVSPS